MLGKAIGIDFGTSSIKFYKNGEGIILHEKSVIAIYNKSHTFAVGNEAYEMYEKSPDNIQVVFPMKNGVIAHFDDMQYLLGNLLKTGRQFVRGSEYVIAVPTDVTEVEKKAFFDLVFHSEARAKSVRIVERGLADALGCGIDILQPEGHMVVDIGGGTADIAVISLGGVVESESIKVAGDAFSEAVVKYIRKKHNVLIGDRTAEELKMNIGCVFPRPEEVTMEIKGRCLMTGLPRVFSVSSSEMIEAFEEPCARVLEAIHSVLERTPPELVADIATNGIVMTGGGSLVWGFDKLVESHTGIETYVADDAISCVAHGTGKSLEWVGDMQDGTLNISRSKQML